MQEKGGVMGGKGPPPPQKVECISGGLLVFVYIYIYECECIAGGNLEKLWGGEVCVLFGYRFIIYMNVYKDVYI